MEKKFFYIEFDYKVKEEDLVVLFRVEPQEGKSIEEVANSIAAESSIGTWTEISTMTEEFRESKKARVFDIDGDYIKIAYPLILFEKGNMAQIYSSIAGNIFGMRDLKNLRVESIKYPDKILKSFPGPKFGIEGIRKKLNIFNRPIIGTIVKPKIGLNPEEQAKVMYEAMVGGIDVVKDDENLTSQDFCSFYERVKKCLEMKKRAEDETGEKKGYIPNVSAETDEMLRRAEFVAKMGGEIIMLDVLTVGFSGLQSLIKDSLDLIIHGHRAMHAAITRNEKHGISMFALSRTYRLLGIDQLHVGTVVGKMDSKREEVLKCVNALRERVEGEGELKQDWCDIKSAMPIASGGLHPGHIPSLYEIFGDDVILQFGGGVHGHPEGTQKGAKAVKDALVAVKNGISLTEAKRNSKELEVASSKWNF